MKKLLLATGILALLSISSAIAMPLESNVKPISPANSNSSQPIIGGWYPVFFDAYDQTKIDSIITTIKENRARRIVVLYDKNTSLANQIISGIQSKVNFAVERNHESPKDGSAQYNHNRVVVTVYTQSKTQ